MGVVIELIQADREAGRVGCHKAEIDRQVGGAWGCHRADTDRQEGGAELGL